MITHWDAPTPFSLVTPVGELDFNIDLGGGRKYLLKRDGCSVDRPLRVTVDNIPQGDGEILHRRFTAGYTVTLDIAMWVGSSPACNDDQIEMVDDLMYFFESALNADDARLEWTPPGGAGRMFTQLRWLSFPTVSQDDVGVSVTVSFDTPFPYEISQLQTTPALGGTVTNNGTTDFWPVLHIDGPVSNGFLVTNGSAGIVYDCGRPGAQTIGGGHYVEIDCFRNTIVLDGDVQDLDAGVDPNLSEFFTFPPGSVTSGLEVDGGAGTGYVLMNDAWA